MSIKGIVKWFDAGKGFGFVVVDGQDEDILLHINVLRNFGRSSIVEGTNIWFEDQKTDRGRQVVEIFDIEFPEINIAEIDQTIEGDIQIPHPDDRGPLLPARVKWFDKAKGFGFINIFGADEDIFVHVEVLRNFGFSDLLSGEAIVTRVAHGTRGLMAYEVRTWDFIDTSE